MRPAELPRAVLVRKAIVYVRQSSMAQVQTNLESQHRQYGLVELARSYGFRDVHVIDDDLGVSASGSVERPGFRMLLAEVCAGEVGAVVCLEASRLARNGRDWHHLVEICGLVDARVIDTEGIYDPRRSNDRLLLGLKGTMSEFELSVLRARLEEARIAKARRGELRLPVPVGYVWSREAPPDIDPDRRVQERIRTVFEKFVELGSARQVLRWFQQNEISFPMPSDGKMLRQLSWRLPRYRHIVAVLKNPFYAGVYAYGKSGTQTSIVNGLPRKSYGHARPIDQWIAVLKDHHPGYISAEQFERNQARLARNAYGRSDGTSKSGRGGRALLSGLLRCRRCGDKLRVTYAGIGGTSVRYTCNSTYTEGSTRACLSFGAAGPDQTIVAQVLTVVQPIAIEAALRAGTQMAEERTTRQRALEMEVEHARYEVQLAARRYEACDPDNRLVAAELEARWNAAMQRLQSCEARLATGAESDVRCPPEDRLFALAGDLEKAWNAPGADMKRKQRIVRVLIEEIVIDVAETGEIVLVIHWRGGQHSELRVRKPKSGEHRRRAPEEAVSLIHSMAGRWNDEQIAATLNRMGFRTGHTNTWTAERVRAARRKRGVHAYLPAYRDGAALTMYEAAKKLGVSSHVIRELIVSRLLPAHQVVRHAPWQINASDLQLPAVQDVLEQRVRRPYRIKPDEKTLTIPGL